MAGLLLFQVCLTCIKMRILCPVLYYLFFKPWALRLAVRLNNLVYYFVSYIFYRETHPPSFKLDLFIRNLDRPSDVVFERLGQ